MLRRRAVIAHAEALEFRVPTVEGSRGRASAHNVIIRLDATNGDGHVRGIGEAARRERTVTGDSSAGSWRFLKAALRRLEGYRFSVQRGGDRMEIAEMLDELGRLAVDMSRMRRSEPPYRGALAGLDIALVDLAAKAAGRSMADFLGGRRTEPATVRAVSTTQSERHLRGEIAAAGGHGVVKLVDLDGREAALDAMSIAANEVGIGQPFWVDLQGHLARPEALKLVEAMVDGIREGALPPHVVLQRPIEPSDHAGLAELQAVADSGAPHDTDRAGVVVMADVWTPGDARGLAAGGVRGLDLNLQRLGGTLAVLDLVNEVHGAYRGVRFGLSVVPQVFGIAARALAEVAAALPALDYLELPELVRGCDVVEPPLLEDRAATWLHPGDAPGLGVRLGLAPVVGHVKRRIEVPQVAPRPLTYGSMPANWFDIEPIQGFATLSWGIPLTDHLLERAALARGLNTMRLWNGVFVADHPDLTEPIGFAMRRTGWTGVSSRRVADDKELSRRLLQAAGVPAPRGAAFNSDEVEQAVEFAMALGTPVAVKPRAGSHGVGVATDLHSESEVRTAIGECNETKFGRGRGIIVEEFVPGNDYRFFVVGDRVVSVVHRRSAFVVGDGISPIVDLVLEKNLVKLQNPHGCTRLIKLGRDAAFWLKRQNLQLDDVPEDRREVRLTGVANGSLGADPIEVLDETHKSMLELAVRATRAVPGLDHCGVDIIGNHFLSTDEQSARVIEVNTAPGSLLNHFPMFGTPRDVSGELVLRSCGLVGFNPPEKRDELSVQIEAFGRVQGVGYRQWFARLADERGLVGSIRNQSSGSVEAFVSGPTADVAALASRAFIGPRKAFVERVETTHVGHIEAGGRFEVTG